MPILFVRLWIGIFFSLLNLGAFAQDDLSCRKDSEGVVWCAPTEGGIGQRPNGEVFCGVGQCITMTNGVVVCAAKEGGRTSLNYIGQAICAGNCVPGKQSLCVKSK